MLHDLCKNPSPAAVPVPFVLEEACRDVLRKHQLLKQPRQRGVLLSCIWVANGLLALILAFLVGFCMGESRGAASAATDPALQGAPPAAQALPAPSPFRRDHPWPR